MQEPQYDIKELVHEAQFRWLKPVEVFFILKNFENHQLTQETPQKPPYGSMYLFNKRVNRFFRRDGHSWRKKEGHERLKVGNVEALNCYYAHCETNPNFQRRSYWMLDVEYGHIVLVHYRDITEVRQNSGIVSQLSVSSSAAHSPSSYTATNPSSISGVDGVQQHIQSSSSPGSVEVSSEAVVDGNGINQFEVSQTLRMIEEQLSLNDDSLENILPLSSGQYEIENGKQDQYENFHPLITTDQLCSGYDGTEHDLDTLIQGSFSVEGNGEHHQPFVNEYTFGSKEHLSWKESPDQEKNLCASDENNAINSNGMPVPYRNSMLQHSASRGCQFSSGHLQELPMPIFLPGEGETFNYHGSAFFDQDPVRIPLIADLNPNIGQKPKFIIREISPEWGYTDDVTKVIIIGSFDSSVCDPLESTSWKCMFGDIEVPLEIIQGGTFRCRAPSHLPGKVAIYITSSNQESCSDIKEFEYRDKPSTCTHCTSYQTETTKKDESLLLVRLVQMLLSDPVIQNSEIVPESGIDQLGKSKADGDTWCHIIGGLSVGNLTPSNITDLLLQELLKDKLLLWLSSRSANGGDQEVASLSKKEQGIIHMVAGLGFGWAIKPILSHGVNVDFRDTNGWTALHWAARFGREDIVASLIALGALARAVTHPTAQDRTGKTPASIADTYGHKGLAGYLAEHALTGHLSSLKLEESEYSKDFANAEAEITVNNISNENLAAGEDQLLLEAVRNAAQAAGRIQAAFRDYSFRRRVQRSASVASVDEYGISSDDIEELSAAFKGRDRYTAALSIQKKYRGWKGRKNFLNLRLKVVKIQAHVRGHQVRKHYYKVLCRAVSILEKAILRWRRRGGGLRGYRGDTESLDESDDEDLLKDLRKQKVDAAIDEDVSRVLSMVKSQEARQQYHRILERYHQAKTALGFIANETAAASLSINDYFMENDGTPPIDYADAVWF